MPLKKDELYSVSMLGRELLELGRLDEARAIFEGLSATNPSEPFAWMGLGCVARAKGQLDASVDLFAHSVKLGAGSQAQLYLAEVLLSLRKIPEAKAQIQALLNDADPDIRGRATILQRRLNV